MPAYSTRIAAAAAVVLLLASVAGLSWQRMRRSSAAHVEMLASLPETSHGTPTSSAATSSASMPNDGESHAAAEREDAPPPPSEPVGATTAAAPPSFDIVRVEPNGEALLAGRGTPNGTVALVDRGKVVAQAKADAGGNFVMTPPALKPGDYALSLREGQGAATKESKQSVVVSVPASKKQQVVVALAEPGKATTLLSAPPLASVPQMKRPSAPTTEKPQAVASAPSTKLAIRSVELENGSGLFASGVAPPGTDVRVYLNNSRVADVAAAAAGAWTVTVRKGLAAGHYAVRADSLKPDRSVGARVEVPFDVPSSPISGTADSTRQGPSHPAAKLADAGTRTDTPVAEKFAARPFQAPLQADAVLDHIDTELVSRGDNLWRISRKRLGQGTRYTEIYAANMTQIRDPKLVYPGQIFVLPAN